MKKKFLSSIAVLIIAILGILIFRQAPPVTAPNLEEVLHGKVISLNGSDLEGQDLDILITKGSQANEIIQLRNQYDLYANQRFYAEDDQVLLSYNPNTDSYYIQDYKRTGTLLILFALFIAVVVAVTRWQGIGSLIGLALSFIILFQIVLPRILSGADPVLSAILGAAFIIPTTFYLSHGVNRKTTIAVFGTLATLIITGLLSILFADIGNLTGLASEEASFLKLESFSAIDFRGLVLAGMIISILGVLDDITISQASVVHQLKAAKKKISFTELFARSMAVGRDHISSMVNTLILVYAGASLPLLLLFLDYSLPLADVINYEFLSEEIIRTLIGSIGLILAVPITTLLACFTIGNPKKSEPSGCSHVH